MENNLINFDWLTNISKEDLRIRSKRFLNMLDLLEKEILSHSLYNFSVTINCSHIKDQKVSLNDAWKIILPQVFLKINSFIKDSNCVSFLICSVEVHRNGFKFKKVLDKNTKVEVKNSLIGYPHVHMMCSFAYNPYVYKKENSFLHTMETFILNSFMDYDVKVNYLNEKNDYVIKNSIKYVLKEYKSEMVNTIFKEFSSSLSYKNKINVFINSNWVSLKNYVQKLKEINGLFFDIHDINLSIDPMIKIEDPVHKIKKFVEFYVKKHDYKIFKEHVYIKSYSGSFSWYCYLSLEDVLYNIAREFPENMDLILKNKNKFLLLNKKTNFLDNLNFLDFSFVEFGDFIIDLHEKEIELKNSNMQKYVTSFCYLGDKLMDVLNQFDNLKLLEKQFLDFNNLYLFMQKFGLIFVNGFEFKKGNSIYLYGPSNSGKSLITEFFLIEIFGEHNVGVLNTKDSRFMLDQISNKHIIILNEFVNKKSNRDIYLKLLDGTLVDINVKYESSIKKSIKAHTVATSNYSMLEQGFDMAFFSRFTEIIMSNNKMTVEERRRILNAIPLFIVCSLFSLSAPVNSFEDLRLYVTNFINEIYSKKKICSKIY